MRVSVNTEDRGYCGPIYGSVIYLDGVRCQFAITADDEEGYVLRYKSDEKGLILLNEARTEALTEEVRGVVRIVMPDAAREEPIAANIKTRISWWVRPLIGILSPLAGRLPYRARAFLASLIARFGVQTDVHWPDHLRRSSEPLESGERA